MGQAPSPAVPDELDHRRERATVPRGQVEPGPDRGSAEARERDVIRVEDGQAAVEASEGRVERMTPRLRERVRPEPVQVVGNGQVGAVRTQLRERHVDVRHEPGLLP